MIRGMRSRRLGAWLISVSALLFAVATAPIAASATSEDWAQFGYGPAHNGYQRTETLINRTNVRNLVRAYRVGTGYTGMPVAVGGRLYMGLMTSSGTGPLFWLLSLRASDGAVLWRRAVDENVLDISPAVANGIVYLTTVRNDYWARGGSLYAFDAVSGALLWRADGIATTSPTVADGTVFVAGGNEGGTSALVAYDATNGAIRWQAEAGQFTQDFAPTVSGGRVYLTKDEGVYAFDEATGVLLWHRPVAGGPGSAAVVASGMVIVGGAYGIYAIDAATGDARWSYPQGDTYFLSTMPAVANGVVYARVWNQLVALRLADGAFIWTRTIHPDPRVAPTSAPVVANGVVYIMGVVDNRDSLLAYGTGGTLRRTIIVHGESPIVSAGTVYVGRYLNFSAFRLPSVAANR